ncbi:DUF6457 domain-containing protein [Aeromicrobium sp.]|uniref:DUF6457 domain-containing protein n=1 Tax=Aeromicrobium sp. TaxID=1871063 RepID=UPI003D6A7828
MSEISLDDWVAAMAAELGLDEVDVDVEQVLDLADAAHAVVRPAAPLTTFVAGLAAGRAGGSADDVREAIDAAGALCDRIAEDA